MLDFLVVAGNDENDQLFLENMLETSEFHNKHYVNTKVWK